MPTPPPSAPPQGAPAPSRGPTRRRLLFAAAAAGAAGALGLRAFVPWGALPPPAGLRTLTAAEARFLARALPALLPVDATPLVPLDRLAVLAGADRAAGRLSPALRARLRAALLFLDHGAVAAGGHLTRGTNLPPAELRAWLLRAAAGGPLGRAAVGAVKQLAAFAYFGDPGAWGPLAYDGPVSRPRGLPRLGHAPFPDEGPPGAGGAP